MTFTRDDFEAWRGNPLTELILDRYLRAELDRTKATHDEMAWGGPLEPAQHAAFRERYETLEWLREMSFEEIDGWMKAQT